MSKSNLDYIVIKTQRKTLQVQYDRQMRLIVRAPLSLSSAQIDKFMQLNETKIIAKLQKMLQLKNELNQNFYYYLGNKYTPQQRQENSPILFEIVAHKILISNKIYNNHERYLNQWYKQQTYILVKPIVEQLSQKYNLRYNSLKITLAETRLGSCNSSGNICFSYKLCRCPVEIIQYVVAHELAHLEHLNHSLMFWQLVAIIYPEYKQAKLWLKNNALILR
ncbi:MAG: SprT family zinc-dependent metalloprotease [Burkholderiales bacterium]|nr:SprT family zinc-dependent metalloprotease [Burkholderiales bacterium]